MTSGGPIGPMVVAVIAILLFASLLWLLVRGYQADEVQEYPPERWYTETVEHCEEALAVLDAFEAEQGLSHDETRAAMGSVVRTMSTHAGKAVETEVDEAVLTDLRTASTACRAVHEAHIRIGDASEWEQAIDRARLALQSAKETAERHRDTYR